MFLFVLFYNYSYVRKFEIPLIFSLRMNQDEQKKNLAKNLFKIVSLGTLLPTAWCKNNVYWFFLVEYMKNAKDQAKKKNACLNKVIPKKLLR